MLVTFTSCLLFFIIIASSLTDITTSASSKALHPDELDALKEIASTLGIKSLHRNYGNACDLKKLKIKDIDKDPNRDINNTIGCDCTFNNNMTTCHITELFLKSMSLPGKLPPQLTKLPYLRSIDFCRNYLSGSIPMEWAKMQHLTFISLCANNLSGKLPTGLQYFKNLRSLGIEGNQFSGLIPDELGNLTNLTQLELASNHFTGPLPRTLAKLVNLEKVRICDNNFTGSIPEYIGNWSRLQKLHLYASGLKGPIPDAVVRLENLIELSVSDTTGINSFPNFSSKNFSHLILRNVSMSGPIPPYIWNLDDLKTLDLSFNKLTGEVQEAQNKIQNIYLTGNLLTGNIENSGLLSDKNYIDLSYNNFSWSSSCQMGSNINTYQSSYLKNNLTGLPRCAGPANCKKYQLSLHINCGGENVTLTNSLGRITYQTDNSRQTNAATNQQFDYWGVSNTGDFTDNDKDDDEYYILSNSTMSGDSSDLYKTARRSALSLVYYAFCLENGNYSVNLHFMEIQFADKELYSRLSRRIFDVYVQGVLVWKDFNIKRRLMTL